MCCQFFLEFLLWFLLRYTKKIIKVTQITFQFITMYCGCYVNNASFYYKNTSPFIITSKAEKMNALSKYEQDELDSYMELICENLFGFGYEMCVPLTAKLV